MRANIDPTTEMDQCPNIIIAKTWTIVGSRREAQPT
jgi:hypothetical protein